MPLERMGGHHGYLIIVARLLLPPVTNSKASPKAFRPWSALVLLPTHQSLKTLLQSCWFEAAFEEEK